MDADEWVHWQARNAIKPLPDRRSAERLALISWVVAQANKAPNTPSIDFDAFVLDWSGVRARQTEDDMEATLQAALAGVPSV